MISKTDHCWLFLSSQVHSVYIFADNIIIPVTHADNFQNWSLFVVSVFSSMYTVYFLYMSVIYTDDFQNWSQFVVLVFSSTQCVYFCWQYYYSSNTCRWLSELITVCCFSLFKHVHSVCILFKIYVSNTCRWFSEVITVCCFQIHSNNYAYWSLFQ